MTEISQEEVDDFLEHFGVKGMKWGVIKSEVSGYNSARKARYSELRTRELSKLTVHTKHGKTVEVSENRELALSSFIGSLTAKRFSTYHENYRQFSFKVAGKKVGDASFNWDNKEDVHLIWLGIKTKERGKGYGSAVFESAISYAKTNGAKKVILEVPGMSPNAQHIYEKQGFVLGKQVTPADDLWGGLREMSLDLTKSSTLSHADLNQEEIEIELAILETFPQLPPEIEDELNHTDEVDDFLEHFGVKGMRWGQRKLDDSNPESPTKNAKTGLSLGNPKVRRAALVGLAITGIVATAFVASRYGVKISNIDPKKVKSGSDKASEILKRPTDIIYMSKAHVGSGVKNQHGIEVTNLKFITKGQTKDFFKVFDDAGLNSDAFKPGDFRKTKNGDVAAIFSDLLGRRDAAGRAVPHAVLIPAEQAVGLNSIEDVIQKFGPRLEREYQSYLETARKAAA